MIPDFSGEYLNFDSTKDGDIVEIISAGEDVYSEALKKKIYNIKVRRNGKEMTYSPNNIAGRALQDAFGMEDSSWKGKKFSVIHVDKKMLIRPITMENASAK